MNYLHLAKYLSDHRYAQQTQQHTYGHGELGPMWPESFWPVVNHARDERLYDAELTVYTQDLQYIKVYIRFNLEYLNCEF